MGAGEGLVGDRECFQDTGLSRARYSCHGMTGDSSGDKACVLPPGTSGSYGMNGSGSKGTTSSMGLSGSSSGFSTGGGSWYISIEEYSQRWIFQGTGTVMIHPNFSHPHRTPSLSPYPHLSDHYH